MPASKINTAAVLAALLSGAMAHTYVKEFQAGGKTYPGFYAADKSGGDKSSPAWWTNQGWGFQPIKGDKINHPDIIAHMDAVPSPFTAPLNAGSDVTFTWEHSGECQGDEVGWDCSHHGWTSTWLAPCDGDCSKVSKTDLKFFKIHETGLIDYRKGRYSAGDAKEQPGYWGTDAIFYDGNNQQTVTIPKDLPSGNYVLRTEVTSIHNNGPVSERQFWPQCMNIAIQKGNDKAPIPSGVAATSIYKDSDALLQWNLYQHTAGKTFANAPGPELAPCAGGKDDGSSTAPAPGYSSAPVSAIPSATPTPSYVATPVESATVSPEPVASSPVAELPSSSAAPAATPAPDSGDGYNTDTESDSEDSDDEDDSDDGENESENQSNYGGHHNWGNHGHWRDHARDFAN